MSRVEEMIAVRAAPPQAMRVLTTAARFAEWIAPDITVHFHTASPTLSPGDRFRIEILGRVSFDYTVEVATDRDLVFAFHGPWSGEERWSFVPDGAETIVRRVYEVRDGSTVAMLAWQTAGRPLVGAHYKLELSRFRDVVERHGGPRAEIAPRHASPAPEPAPPPSYTIDES
jgi:uncharacterized protein YndB with AHSA1/START domain